MSAWQIFVRGFVEKGGYRTFLTGLQNTALIAVFGLIIGVVIGTLLAVVKVVPKYRVFPKILEKFADIYIGFFRGTPMVVQLLLGYFVLMPALDLHLDPVLVAIIIFGMNSGAYVSEIMRAGINSVDPGQMEAGRSLGLTYATTMLKVVIPQAIKNILPTLGNEFIVLVKETSVVSFIAAVDITRAFRSIADASYEYVVPYLMLALTYLIIVIAITIGIRLLERRFRKNERRS